MASRYEQPRVGRLSLLAAVFRHGEASSVVRASAAASPLVMRYAPLVEARRGKREAIRPNGGIEAKREVSALIKWLHSEIGFIMHSWLGDGIKLRSATSSMAYVCN